MQFNFKVVYQLKMINKKINILIRREKNIFRAKNNSNLY